MAGDVALQAVALDLDVPVELEEPESPMVELADVDVEIRFVTGQEAMVEGEDPLLKVLSEEDVELLHQVEPHLLEWIYAGPENAALFVADPISALRSAELGIADDLLDELELIRQQNLAAEPSYSGFRIRSIKVVPDLPSAPLSAK